MERRNEQETGLGTGIAQMLGSKRLRFAWYTK